MRRNEKSKYKRPAARRSPRNFEQLESRQLMVAFSAIDLFTPGTPGFIGSAAGPTNDSTYIHFPGAVGTNQPVTGVDLPTNQNNPGGLPDSEWSGIAYHVDGNGVETIWVVPDEVARIEVFRLHGSTYVQQNGQYTLQPIRTIPINGAPGNQGPEGITWTGNGNMFAFVWEGTGQIRTANINPGVANINFAAMGQINLNPNPELDGTPQAANDGLEGVAFDGLNYYVVKEIGTNQGVYQVAPNGNTVQLNIPEFNAVTTNSNLAPNAQGNYATQNNVMFNDFSDIAFAGGFLYVTTEKGREAVTRINLNPVAGQFHVDEVVSKARNAPFNAFALAHPMVNALQIPNNVDVLMQQIEGISIKPDGLEAFLAADDDQGNNGNDVIDYRWFVDRAVRVTGDFDGDGNVFRDLGDINMIHAAIVGGNQAAQFDLDNNGIVDADDGLYLVQRIMQVPLGDSNLDGVYDSNDLVLVFGAGEYEDAIANNSTWAEGDWNFDGDFTTGDWVVVEQEGRYQG